MELVILTAQQFVSPGLGEFLPEVLIWKSLSGWHSKGPAINDSVRAHGSVAAA
jgi:hypothetical protein